MYLTLKFENKKVVIHDSHVLNFSMTLFHLPSRKNVIASTLDNLKNEELCFTSGKKGKEKLLCKNTLIYNDK